MTDEAMSEFERGVDAIFTMASDLEHAPFVTLSTAAAMMERAISFGAGIYNNGNPRQCCHLYIQAATLILDASQHNPELTPCVQDVLQDLRDTIARARACEDDNHAAWVMRHVFDKTIVRQQLATERLQWMMKLAEAAFGRGDYAGSASALRTALPSARDLITPPNPDDPGIQVAHLAILYYGHALLLQTDVREAYDLISNNAEAIPGLVAQGFDLRTLGEHYAPFEAALVTLEAWEPCDDDFLGALFLRAYIYLFSNRRREAATLLTHAITRHPQEHALGLLLALTASGDTQA